MDKSTVSRSTDPRCINNQLTPTFPYYHSIQRYIVRILFVAPVYALGSVLSLRFPNAR
jgi:hypothetical protein